MWRNCFFTGLFYLTSLAIPMAAHEVPALFEKYETESYRVRGNGYAVEIHGHGMTLGTAAGTAQLRWLGAEAGTVQSDAPQPTKVNYLTGSDRSRWRTGIPTFGRLRVPGLYRHIDVVYYGTERQLEYDFVVKPGGDPAAIRFALTATLGADGELVLRNGLRWRKPVASQGGKLIASRFVKRGDATFGIEVGDYDRSRELVIDPVLTYGTFIGGSLTDEASGVVADAAGFAYVVGSTTSTDFPGTTRGQTFGGQDAFVAKVNQSGRGLEWATYIGGTGIDSGRAIAIDATGAVYVTGQTASTNFPVSANAPQSRLSGGSGVTDAFVVKLSPNGRDMVYSTFLGGTQSDAGNAIAVDAAGAAFVGGWTESTDFPSTTRDTLPARGAGDGFVTKVAADGGALVYSSLLGGFALDTVLGLVVDAAGSAHVTGETRSSNFPVTDGAYQQERKGSADAFVSKLSVDGKTLVFSSYFGGAGQETGRALTIDRAGSVYVAGVTSSVDLPVSFNGAQRSPMLLPDAFVAKLDSTGASLIYGTYIGGDGNDEAMAIAVDGTGAAYVAGQTSSFNFPLFNDGPLPASGPAGGIDGFVTRVSSGGNFLQFSTMYGGPGTDSIVSMASDGRGRIWLAGSTDSASLPTSADALASVRSGASDGFVALLSEILVTVTPGTMTLGPREIQQFSAVVSNTANQAVRWTIFPDIGTITQTGLYTAPATFTGSPTIAVSAISLADGSKIGQASVTLESRVSVAVEPRDVSLLAGRTQQFVAIVSGTTNTAVTWSITPVIGSISASGLYTAPASFLAEAAVTVQATSVAETSRSAMATVRLTLPPTAPLPLISAAGFTNAASFRASVVEGGVSPGELLTIFGQNMGPEAAVTLQLDARGFVATRLGGTRVLFDGVPGAMVVTSAGQVSTVVPYAIEGQGSVAVAVEYNGRASAPVSLPVVGATPGIFTQNSSGSGPGAIIHQNGQLVTASNPAEPGEVVTLFGTGEGATTPAGVDGKPTATPLPAPKLPVKVVVDGMEVDPLYAGGAPGLVAGVLQVNFTLPAGASGARRIRLRIGDVLSPDTVTVPAR